MAHQGYGTALLLALLSVGLLGRPLAAHAQQPKVPRIGIVFVATPSAYTARIEAFRQGLRELGYVEGKNIVIEYRYAEGKLDRQPTLVAELVRLGVDVIVTGGQTLTRFAKDATSTIPIVMANDGDPVGTKFVASLARPGGNITGLSNFSADISGKRLELLTEIVPRAARVAVLGTATEPGNAQSLKATELAAGALRVQLQYLDIPGSKDIETAFRAASKGRADAVLVLGTAVFISQRKHMAALAAQSRLPAIYSQREYTADGGLVAYGPNITDLFRRAATYVDKILKGAKPADLPVEQPTKFELVINMKTAKALGLTIPQSVLIRADEVIQ
jgi:putative ABC transport system substrate-binding protein